MCLLCYRDARNNQNVLRRAQMEDKEINDIIIIITEKKTERHLKQRMWVFKM